MPVRITGLMMNTASSDIRIDLSFIIAAMLWEDSGFGSPKL